MEPEKQKYLDFLLADFNSIKTEIARRSNLQKAVIASMLAFYAWTFQYLLNNESELLIIIIAWIVSFLGYTFYIRESAEIQRLGWTIKDKIAKPAAEILGKSSGDVIPSQSFSKAPDNRKTKQYISKFFKLILYLIAPSYLTISYILMSYCT